MNNTLNTFWNAQRQMLESIMKLEFPLPLIHKVDTLGQMSTEEKQSFGNRLGDCGEHVACALALCKGAEVFKNISGVGPADLIIKPKETNLLYEIDVKTANFVKEQNRWEVNKGGDLAVGSWLVVFIPEKGNPHVRWPYTHGGSNTGNRPFVCPPGLEDFWN